MKKTPCENCRYFPASCTGAIPDGCPAYKKKEPEHQRVQHLLMEEWRELRNDIGYRNCVEACIRFAYRMGLITRVDEELWLRRITTCPGHDDEGGRSWCAYCGNMAETTEQSKRCDLGRYKLFEKTTP